MTQTLMCRKMTQTLMWPLEPGRPAAVQLRAALARLPAGARGLRLPPRRRNLPRSCGVPEPVTLRSSCRAATPPVTLLRSCQA